MCLLQMLEYWRWGKGITWRTVLSTWARVTTACAVTTGPRHSVTTTICHRRHTRRRTLALVATGVVHRRSATGAKSPRGVVRAAILVIYGVSTCARPILSIYRAFCVKIRMWQVSCCAMPCSMETAERMRYRVHRFLNAIESGYCIAWMGMQPTERRTKSSE